MLFQNWSLCLELWICLVMMSLPMSWPRRDAFHKKCSSIKFYFIAERLSWRNEIKSDKAKDLTEKDCFKSKSTHSVLQRFALWFHHFTSFVLGTRKSCWFTVINDCMPFTCKMTHRLEPGAATALSGGDQEKNFHANPETGRSSDERRGSRARDDSKDEVNFNSNRRLFQAIASVFSNGVD